MSKQKVELGTKKLTRANGEIQKANEKVAELEPVLDEVKAATKGKDALTQSELDAIDTTIDTVEVAHNIREIRLTSLNHKPLSLR